MASEARRARNELRKHEPKRERARDDARPATATLRVQVARRKQAI